MDLMSQPKYARLERERRFLLDQFPTGANVVQVRRITDRYIDGTTLRLREQRDDGLTMFKLTQKLSSPGSGAQQGFITNMYITGEEFQILSRLPALTLSKTRHSVPPFGIDVFETGLQGLILAEAEFDSVEEAEALIVPPFAVAEVSTDQRFTGGQIARASRKDVAMWLLEHGIRLDP
jgi:CYTH domain-containing protein